MVLRFPSFLLILLFLASCKQDSPNEGEPYVPAPAPSVQYKHTDNTIRLGLRSEPNTLNPLLTAHSESRYLSEMIFQPLNGFDPINFELVPYLAGLPDIQKEANGQVGYAYVINEAAAWPNGLPVTAADVIFSMKLALNPLISNGAYRPYYEFVDNIVTTPSDERQFRVMADGPYVIAEAAIGDLKIYPEYVYDPEYKLRKIRLSDLASDQISTKLAETDEDLKSFSESFTEMGASRDPAAIVGSGPYELSDWGSGKEMTLTRRDNYWAADTKESWLRADAEQIQVTFIQDPNTMATALRDELLDVVVNLDIEQFKQLREEPYLMDRYEFATVPSMKFFGIILNQQNPLLKDVNTRRALAHLVDVDQIIEQLFPGDLADRLVGPVLPAKSYYHDELELIDYDPSVAGEMLKSAGWQDSDGNGILDREVDGELQELSFEFLTFPSQTSEAIGTLVAEWSSQVGIDIKPVVKEPKSLFSELDKGNFAMSIIGQGFLPIPDEFTQVWASGSIPPNGSNRSGFADDEADRLIRQIRVTIDPQKREELYRRFQEIVYENQPMIFLLTPQDRLVVNRRFQFEARSYAPNVSFNAIRQQAWNASK